MTIYSQELLENAAYTSELQYHLLYSTKQNLELHEKDCNENASVLLYVYQTVCG